jgi:hypothetical protein
MQGQLLRDLLEHDDPAENTGSGHQHQHHRAVDGHPQQHVAHAVET